jgi:hypothetical protein
MAQWHEEQISDICLSVCLVGREGERERASRPSSSVDRPCCTISSSYILGPPFLTSPPDSTSPPPSAAYFSERLIETHCACRRDAGGGLAWRQRVISKARLVARESSMTVLASYIHGDQHAGRTTARWGLMDGSSHQKSAGMANTLLQSYQAS